MTKPLWAPWRMEFILGDHDPGGCILCDKPAQGPAQHAANLILAVRPRAFVMMNRFPYTNGHLLVSPRAHAPSLPDLVPEDHAALWDLVRDSLVALDRALHPDGMNVGLNLGRSAGAGITGHVHVHLVPRWSGDTNFMPVVADVRVMPEHLQATWERLRPAFAPLSAGGGDAP